MKRRISVIALLSLLVLAAVGCKKESPTEPSDTTPPTVSILSPLNNSAVSDTVLIQVQATDNSGVTKVEFYTDGVLVSTKASAPWEYKWPTKGLQPLSMHTIIAKAYDPSGNVGTSPTDTVTIKDVTIPTISILSPANNSVVSDTVTITVQATDDVGVTKVEFYIDGNLASSKTSAPWAYQWSTQGLSSLSVHSLLAKAYDGSGNVGISSTINVVLKDVIPPVIAILSPTNNASVSDTVLVQVQATDNVSVTKVEFYIDGVLVLAKGTAPWECKWPTKGLQVLGTHTILAKAYDAAGNIGTSSTVNVTIRDVSLPTVSILAPSNNSVVSDTVTITAQASDDVGVTKVEFYVDGNLVFTKNGTPWEYKWSTQSLVALSSHTIVAKAYDGSGNVGTSGTVTVIIKDKIAPTVAILSPLNNSQIPDTVLVQVTATDNIGVTKVDFYIDGSLSFTKTSSPWEYKWIASNLVPLSSHTIIARAYDAAGNIGTSATVNVTIQQPIGNIIGKVLNKVNGNPIDGVQITTQPATSVVITDYSGNYTITDLAMGTYKVIASRANYISDSVVVTVGRWATVRADFGLYQITAIPAAGLVAYYPFNGNAIDASGNGYNGAVYGATLTMDRFQKVNSSYQFNGSSSYIDISNTSNLNFLTGGFSLAAWILFTDDTRTQCIFGKGKSNVTAGYLLAIVGTKVDLVVDGQFAVADNSTLKGSWHFVCGVYDGTNGYLYLDGQQRAMTSMTYVHASTANIKIGNIDVPENFFTGMIDDVRIYNRPLTPAEVQLLFHEGGW